jgi:heme/copper-type cytochrome/quinol oxidase subunit 2
MNMSRSVWIHIPLAIVIALAALFFIRLHNAGGVSSELPSLSTEG